MAKKSNRDQAQTPAIAAVVVGFDYQVLSASQRDLVQRRTGEIRERLQRSAQDIWEIGQRLVEVRSHLRHGQFDAWLRAEFGWSRRTAYNFMNVYETFQERANLSDVDIATSALYLLAAPSTPPEVREQYLQQARAGKKLTHKDLRGAMPPKGTTADPVALQPAVSPKKQEIIGFVRRQPQPVAVEVKATVVPQSEVTSNWTPLVVTPGWYRLQTHLVLCGDTAAARFADQLTDVALALAVTSESWDHDWLVDIARSLVVIPEEALHPGLLEQLLTLFSQPGETVAFPWLPQADMIAIAHRLGRIVVAGDASSQRCQQAMVATELAIETIEL